MSNIYSFIVLLLCLSFHVCNARPLGATSKKPEKDFHLSSKNEEMGSPVEFSSTSKTKASLSKQLGGLNIPKETRVVEADDHRPLSSNAKEVKNERVGISGSAQTETLTSVSWRMPQKKRGEPQPGFNLDYSPPKTHPPVHN